MDTSTPAIELTPVKNPTGTIAKRQYRTFQEKRQIVEETLAEGASVARIARAHGINANQVLRLAQAVSGGATGRREPCAQVVAGPGKREFAATGDNQQS
jgi:transposase-like protein